MGGLVVGPDGLFTHTPIEGSMMYTPNGLHMYSNGAWAPYPTAQMLDEVESGLSGMVQCPRCLGEGGGYITGPTATDWDDCEMCSGTGEVPRTDDSRLPVESDILAFLRDKDLGVLRRWDLVPYPEGWRVKIWVEEQFECMIVGSGALFPKAPRFKGIVF